MQDNMWIPFRPKWRSWQVSFFAGLRNSKCAFWTNIPHMTVHLTSWVSQFELVGDSIICEYCPVDIQTHTQVSYWEMWVTKTWQSVVTLSVVNKTQVEFSRLNDYLFDFCMPKSKGSSRTFIPKHEHVDSWVRHVLSLSLCTGDTQRHAHMHSQMFYCTYFV